MTLQHELALVVLLEQLYRVASIKAAVSLPLKTPGNPIEELLGQLLFFPTRRTDLDASRRVHCDYRCAGGEL